MGLAVWHKRLILGLGLLVVAPVAAAQNPVTTGGTTSVDSLLTMLSGSRRAKITRAQLETSLAEINRALESSAYSGALRQARQAEADLIRKRLDDGDLYPGDVIAVQVLGDPQMTQSYTVTPRRTLQIPGIPDEIDVSGLLRSEIEDYLNTVIAKYVRNPTVWAEPLLRVTVFGAVGRPGYFIVPASMPLPDIIMNFAGGPAPNADPKRGGVFRGDKEVLPGAAVDEAIREARSIDALNLQSGDRIEMGAKPTRSFLGKAFAVLGGAASLTYILIRIF